MIRAAVVGCGRIGTLRAREVTENARSTLVAVIDANTATASRTAKTFDVAWSERWQDAMADGIDVIIVSTPNAFLAEIAGTALRYGKHVLMEKPMGRNLSEALTLHHQAEDSQTLLKIGFNHRYHPALQRAHQMVEQQSLGAVVNARAVYGHGGRPGYGGEWRGDVNLAGGGEATDQGIHVFDLLHWFLGEPQAVFGRAQRAVWPIAPLEDNAFGIIQYPRNVLAIFHTSWTQWKNKFSYEIFCENGSLCIEGLGRNYGPERLRVDIRNPAGGVPLSSDDRFESDDLSWKLEWNDFLDAILQRKAYMGTSHDGIVAMATLDAFYRSAESGSFADVVKIKQSTAES